MKLPSNIYVFCPSCQEETMNHVLKSSGGKKAKQLEAVLECMECQQVHRISLENQREIKVNIVISKGHGSSKTQVDLPRDEVLMVGDELMVEESRVIVTSLESEIRREKMLPIGKIKTIWAKDHEKVSVKVSIVDKAQTTSRKLMATPEEEFEIGGVVDFPDISCVISSIKTKDKNLRKGFERAENILRLYTKSLRTERHKR